MTSRSISCFGLGPSTGLSSGVFRLELSFSTQCPLPSGSGNHTRMEVGTLDKSPTSFCFSARKSAVSRPERQPPIYPDLIDKQIEVGLVELRVAVIRSPTQRAQDSGGGIPRSMNTQKNDCIEIDCMLTIVHDHHQCKHRSKQPPLPPRSGDANLAPDFGYGDPEVRSDRCDLAPPPAPLPPR